MNKNLLAGYVDTLPETWKWAFATVPTPFVAEWQAWLAAAQQAETMALLRYWAGRQQSAA